MIKLTELIKKDCNCGSSCCSVKESVEDKNRSRKNFNLMKHEGGFRDKMFKLEPLFLWILFEKIVISQNNLKIIKIM